MIRKLKDGRYRPYSKKKDPKTGRRRNLGTFASRGAAEKHERPVQFFNRGGKPGPAAPSCDRGLDPRAGDRQANGAWELTAPPAT